MMILMVRCLLLSLFLGTVVLGQSFSSGSDGSDGALSFTTPGTLDFDPVALGLDPDGDHVFHFTTITIGADVVLRLSARQINGPVFWLASGDVQIDGTVDLNGGNGQDSAEILNRAYRAPSEPGSGGFAGGIGGYSNVSNPHPGSGPGGGITNGNRGGGGGGHASNGGNAVTTSGGGSAYGNSYAIPLIGG